MINQECFHHYALDSNGHTIGIESVSKDNRHNGYRCVSCGGDMIPVLGAKREHHFRHKVAACSYESYIHKLWKQFFYEQWQRLEHLYVTYNVVLSCDKSANCKLHEKDSSLKCNDHRGKERIDLKEQYDTCVIEGVFGGYRADILLTNSKQPDVIPTFVEINYTHPCDEQKQQANIPIVELKVYNDNPLLPINLIEGEMHINGKGRTPGSYLGVKIYGVKRMREAIHNVRRFYVYQDENNINHGKVDETILSCHQLDEHLPNSMMEIFVADKEGFDEGKYFEYGLKEAERQGIQIGHCLFCAFRNSKRSTCHLRLNTNTETLLINVNDLSDFEIDKTNHSMRCKSYSRVIKKSTVREYDFPCEIWKNDDYVGKPSQKPTIMTKKSTIERMREIALQRIPIQKSEFLIT